MRSATKCPDHGPQIGETGEVHTIPTVILDLWNLNLGVGAIWPKRCLAMARRKCVARVRRSRTRFLQVWRHRGTALVLQQGVETITARRGFKVCHGRKECLESHESV